MALASDSNGSEAPHPSASVKLIDCDTHYLIPSNLDPEEDPNVIRVLCISDTHSKHPQIPNLPEADILVHAGDFSNVGTLSECKSYNEWIGDLLHKKNRFEYAILIAGNHDITLEEDYYNETGYELFHHGTKQDYKQCIDVIRNGHSVYLEDDTVELLGVSFYGSPYQPEFCEWAFNLPRGEALKKEWSKIPDQGVQVLITHGPPKYHGDRQNSKMVGLYPEFAGCNELRERLKEIKDVEFHVFGHIHEGYGVTTDQDIDGVSFINASSVAYDRLQGIYKVLNKPIMFYVKGRGREHSDRQCLWKEKGDGNDEEKKEEIENEEDAQNAQNEESLQKEENEPVEEEKEMETESGGTEKEENVHSDADH